MVTVSSSLVNIFVIPFILTDGLLHSKHCVPVKSYLFINFRSLFYKYIPRFYKIYFIFVLKLVFFICPEHSSIYRSTVS